MKNKSLSRREAIKAMGLAATAMVTGEALRQVGATLL